MSIFQTAVKKPITTILIFVACVVFGLFSLTRLSVDLLPEIEMNQISVMTTYPGAGALDIETNITKILEDGLNTIDNLKKINSVSKDNISIITVELNWGTDLDVAASDIRDKLEMYKTALPEGAEPPIILKFSTSMMPIMTLSATAKESLPALYKILDEQLANPINRIDGVGTVSISGAPKREIQVHVDPRKIEAYNLSVERIGQIISQENINMPAGVIDIGANTLSLRVQGEFAESKELKHLVVASVNGKNVYLEDIANVVDTVEERMQESYTNGIQGASISIQKQSGANTVDIAKKVKAALPGIQAKLPSDVQVNIIIDSSENIENSISSLMETVMFAFLFVILVVLAFLGRWRATLIIVLTIPVSLIVSFIYLMVSGNTINIISLSSLSIAIGMVVDDAIVVLENITTHIERGSPPKQAAIFATNEVSLSVIASTLTIVAVFFPLTLISGFAGVMFKQLGWMVTIIITFSTLCALTLTPMLCSRILKLNPTRGKIFNFFYLPVERALDKLDVAYARLLKWSLTHKKIIISISLALFIGSLFLIKGIGTGFFPNSDNGKIKVTVQLPMGTKVEYTRELAAQIADVFKENYPEIEILNYSLGQAADDNVFASMGNTGTHIITYSIALTNSQERDRDVFEITDLMRSDIAKFPEVAKSEVNAGGGHGGMGNGSYVDVEIYGYDLNETDKIAQDIKQVALGIEGARDVLISREEYKPELQVEFDREKLAMNGLSWATASQYVRNRINGYTASRFREDGDEYDIVVRYNKEDRMKVEDIENIIIYNAQGKGVRVADVGKVVESFSPPSIERQDKERVVKVSIAIEGVSLDYMVKELNQKLAKMDIPSEIGIKIGGTYEDQQESFGDLGLLMLLVILLVYIVMASQFESLKSPFIIMLSLPFGLTGVLAALYITNTDLNLISLIGAIMLVGIVVKNGIVLIDYINLNRERGMRMIEAVSQGGKSRLRPILMTTLTTVLGMIPMAIGIGEGSEMWQPMGVAIIGGLTVSTVLTLIFIPVVYAIFGGDGVVKMRNRKKK